MCGSILKLYGEIQPGSCPGKATAHEYMGKARRHTSPTCCFPRWRERIEKIVFQSYRRDGIPLSKKQNGPFWTIFPHGCLHPCLSVVTRSGDSPSAGASRNASAWFGCCTSTANYPGIHNGAAQTSGSGSCARICLLENDRSFSPSLLSEARERVSECRCSTFLMLPHRSEPFICVITISCAGLSLWLLNSLLCTIHPHFSLSH